MNSITLKTYIIILCLLDYFLTVIGIQFGYIKELNPIFDIFFLQNKYTLGLTYKLLLTLMGLQLIDNNKEMISYNIILTYILCIYLTINGLHILYAVLEMLLRYY